MSSKGLAEIQAAVQDFLTDKISDPGDITLETPTFSRDQRLQIYYEAYRLRLIDALAKDFPALKMHLGEEDYTVLAHDYIAQYPSHNPSLRWFGQQLPSYLRIHELSKNVLVLVELAEFEWAQVMAFDAADTPLVTLEILRTLLPEQWMNLRLSFHPSLQRLRFYSNAPNVWSAIIKNNSIIPVEINAEAQAWIVWREDLQVVYRPVEQPEIMAIDGFLNQQNFADICSDLCEWFPADQVPMQAAKFLQGWILGGLVTEAVLFKLS